jgi:hypothetical protein
MESPYMIYRTQTSPHINKMKNICIHQHHDFGCMHPKKYVTPVLITGLNYK